MKRWLRRLAIVAAIVIVVLVAAVVGIRWWGQVQLTHATAAFEAEVGPLDLSRFLLPELPDEQNAAVWLLAGGHAVEVPSEHSSTWQQGHSVPLDDWTPELRERVESLIEANQPAIDLLVRSLPLEESNFGIPYEQGMKARVPPVIELWRAGKWIRLDARLALLEGNRSRLGRDIALLDRLATSVARESLLMTALIGLSLDRLLIETTWDVLQGFGSDAQVRALVYDATLAATLSEDELQSEGDSYRSRFSARILAQLSSTMLLEGHAELWGMMAEPFSHIRAFYLSDRGLPAWNVYGMMLPNYLDAIGKAKAIETSRLLALESLELRLACLESGDYPDRVELDFIEPYAAEPISVEWASDGGMVLSAPKAAELWAEVYRDAQPVEAPPLSWTLPACSDSR